MRRKGNILSGYFKYCIVLLCLVMFSSCSYEQAEFSFILGTEPETIDPAISTGVPEGRIERGLFEGLTTSRPTDLKNMPGMAKSWEISEDGLVYTFHLRAAQWSNGDPVTAHDFVWSWRRVLEPETAAQYAYMLWYIKNARLYNEGKLQDFSQVGIEAPDAKTVRIVLENPTPFFLYITSFQTLLPVNRRCVEKHGSNWIKPENIVVNGPFTLEEWRMRDRLLLVKNHSYWDKENVRLNSIEALTVENTNTSFNLYMTGRAQWTDSNGMPLNIMDKLIKRPDCHIAPYLGVYFIRCNVTEPPLNDVRIRKALAMTIRKDQITERVTRAGQIPADSFVPPGLPDYEGPEGIHYDPEAAKKLLAEAGYPNGENFPELVYLYNTFEAHRDIAEVLQEQWRKYLGIHVELENQEWKVYLNSQRSLDYQLSRAAWIGDYPDPNTFLDMFITDGGNNNTGWSNQRYDELIRSAALEKESRKRMEIFRQAEKLLIEEELPVIPIYFYVSQHLHGPEVKGIHQNILDKMMLKYAYIKK